MSGRPPPLPPTACATAPASLPACTLEVRSLVTAETMETLESSAEARTTTALFHLLRRASAKVRSCWRSMPSTRAANTFTSFTVRACRSRSPMADCASLSLSCSLFFKRTLTGQRAFDVLDQFGFGDANHLREPTQGIAQLLIIRDSRFAGDSLDAAHARRDAAFVNDLEQTDIPSAPHVRSTAQFPA